MRIYLSDDQHDYFDYWPGPTDPARELVVTTPVSFVKPRSTPKLHIYTDPQGYADTKIAGVAFVQTVCHDFRRKELYGSLDQSIAVVCDVAPAVHDGGQAIVYKLKDGNSVLIVGNRTLDRRVVIKYEFGNPGLILDGWITRYSGSLLE